MEFYDSHFRVATNISPEKYRLSRFKKQRIKSYPNRSIDTTEKGQRRRIIPKRFELKLIETTDKAVSSRMTTNSSCDASRVTRQEWLMSSSPHRNELKMFGSLLSLLPPKPDALGLTRAKSSFAHYSWLASVILLFCSRAAAS